MVNFMYKNSHIIISKLLLHYYFYISLFRRHYFGSNTKAFFFQSRKFCGVFGSCIQLLLVKLHRLQNDRNSKIYISLLLIDAPKFVLFFSFVCSSKKMMLRKSNFFLFPPEEINTLFNIWSPRGEHFRQILLLSISDATGSTRTVQSVHCRLTTIKITRKESGYRF